MQDKQVYQSGKLFFPVSVLMLFPNTKAEFRVYLKHDGKYVLYTKERQLFTSDQRQALYDRGLDTVYVLSEQKKEYEYYLEKYLGEILTNPDIPAKERARTFYESSRNIVRDLFEKKMPQGIDSRTYQGVVKMVENSVRFLSREGSMKNVARLISHDFRTFSHSVNVFSYTTSVLSRMGVDEEELKRVGIGAMLHDIGMTRIPRTVLEKKWPLSPRDKEVYTTHPVQGVAACAHIPLPQVAINCILLHHERIDGKGFPSGLMGDKLPLAVKVLAICDTYDLLTSERQGQPLTPYQALVYIRDKMKGAFEPEVFKHFVAMLAGAEIVSRDEANEASEAHETHEPHEEAGQRPGKDPGA
jgi:putative nucleotidyltransferase with HDIG domain